MGSPKLLALSIHPRQGLHGLEETSSGYLGKSWAGSGPTSLGSTCFTFLAYTDVSEGSLRTCSGRQGQLEFSLVSQGCV